MKEIKRRIPKEFYGIEITLLNDTSDGGMRVALGGSHAGYEQEPEETDEDFIFVIEDECRKKMEREKLLNPRITRASISDLISDPVYKEILRGIEERREANLEELRAEQAFNTRFIRFMFFFTLALVSIALYLSLTTN